MPKREYVESNGYPCDPIRINEDLWLYAEPKGLMVVTNPKGLRGYISWAKILRAVEDHKKAKSRRVRRTVLERGNATKERRKFVSLLPYSP